jgi:hypothetical protein
MINGGGIGAWEAGKVDRRGMLYGGFMGITGVG